MIAGGSQLGPGGRDREDAGGGDDGGCGCSVQAPARLSTRSLSMVAFPEPPTYGYGEGRPDTGGESENRR